MGEADEGRGSSHVVLTMGQSAVAQERKRQVRGGPDSRMPRSTAAMISSSVTGEAAGSTTSQDRCRPSPGTQQLAPVGGQPIPYQRYKEGPLPTAIG
jgi:hypothetical protein